MGRRNVFPPESQNDLDEIRGILDNVAEGTGQEGPNNVFSFVVKQEGEKEIEEGATYFISVTVRDLADGDSFNVFIENPTDTGYRLSGAGTIVRAGGRANLTITENVEKTVDGADEPIYNILVGSDKETVMNCETDVTFTGGTQVSGGFVIGGARNFALSNATEVEDRELLEGANIVYEIENDAGRTEDYQFIHEFSQEKL